MCIVVNNYVHVNTITQIIIKILIMTGVRRHFKIIDLVDVLSIIYASGKLFMHGNVCMRDVI